ncbi:hypothetical protein ACFLQL_02975 [Verrucomicrobiota bacterium]
MTQKNINDLPLGANPPALEFPHFPTRQQAVVWRNWGLVTASRLAKVLNTTETNIVSAAHEMGLIHAASNDTEKMWLKRGYITLIRQNWHLLPYTQLLKLLGRTPDQIAYALKEDDFLWNKLGRLKPNAAPVTWAALTPAETQKTIALKKIIKSAFTENRTPPRAQPFDFLKHYGKQPVVKHHSPAGSPFNLKLVYSFSAVYGDPLLDPELDPFPDSLLSDLAANGMNAVWLQGVLYTLVPWFGENSFSRGHEKRVVNLNRLVERAAKFGIGVYLYLNEPRAMPPEFFDDRPDWKGAQHPNGNISLCMSQADVLNAFKTGVSDLFRKAPGLAGVFTIARSENPTHCHSHPTHLKPCPRCSTRPEADLIALVNNAVAEGVHTVKPEADVIVWNWPWEDEWAMKVIDQLRPDIKFMCTSESFVPTNAMGIKGYVSDYSISKVGPGPQAVGQWKHAAARGLPIMAKVQLNNTWECSAVPYLPVPFLVKQHLKNLEAHKVTALMASWTLGGYPGGNLPLTDMEPEELAVDKFGQKAAPGIIKAWKKFGDAFKEFPFHGCACLYRGPQNYGPMNLLFAEPTGRESTMIGFPYDDLEKWRGNHFPEDIFEEQFRKLSEGWGKGLALLKNASRLVPEEKKAAITGELNVAAAAYCHFRSTYLQIRFIRLRNSGINTATLPDINRVLDEEQHLAEMLTRIVRDDSRIGFEATNHYYYTVNTLMEKALNCNYLKKQYQPLIVKQ